MSDSQQIEAVFVYGSLRVGGYNFPLVEQFVVGVHMAALPGFLMFGQYQPFPFIAHNNDPLRFPGARVIGEVLWLDSSHRQLAMNRLDALEGVPHHYRRELVTVDLIGRPLVHVDAWTYTRTPLRVEIPAVIPSGDWHKRRR